MGVSEGSISKVTTHVNLISEFNFRLIKLVFWESMIFCKTVPPEKGRLLIHGEFSWLCEQPLVSLLEGDVVMAKIEVTFFKL